MIKGKLIDALVFFNTLTLKKVINGFFLRFSYFISKTCNIYLHWGKIESLSIEPTNLCNLKCPECPSGNNTMTRPRIFLPKNNFEDTVNEIATYLSSLQLFFQGEPFLHPKIFDFIKHATSKNIYTTTSTNGQFLTSDNCLKIIESGLHRIIVSVDGTTQETYEKYRVGGSLDLVINGIIKLQQAKRALKSNTPFIIMQFVVFSSNEHQLSDVKKLAKQLKVNSLQIKTAQIDDFVNGNPLIPKNLKLSRYQPNKNGQYFLNRKSNFKCNRIWNGAVITADNKLLPCCFDKNAEYPYTELAHKDTNKSWKNDNAKAFRKKVWSKQNQIEMCKNCTEGLK